MKKDSAEIVVKSVLSATQKLNDIVVDLQRNAEEEEFVVLRRAVGNVLGTMHDELLVPVFRQFPELKPAVYE